LRSGRQTREPAARPEAGQERRRLVGGNGREW